MGSRALHERRVVNAYNRVARCCPIERAEAEAKKNGGPLDPGVCIGLKVVKNWGLHPIIERSTLEDIFKRLRNGKLEGASRVLLPETPDDAEYKGH